MGAFITNDRNTASLDDLVVKRRVLLGLTLGSLALQSADAMSPQEGGGGAQEKALYRYRNLEKCYDLWPKQTPIPEVPPYQEYVQTIELCRRATCVVSYMHNGFSRAIHSGYLVAIPEQFQTENSRGKRYVATCEHGREGNAGAPICLLLPNGESVSPRRELVLPIQKNGSPRPDLKVLECDARQFGDLPALLLGELPFVLPSNAPTITYEPLDCNMPLTNGAQPGTIARYTGGNYTPLPEKFILTHVSQGEVRADSLERFGQNRGFTTGGQLFAGGSGSPVLVFLEGKFRLAGHQVSYSPEPPSDDFINGELRCDGFAVHVNGIIELLKQRGYWR